ncbi:MAG: hybrid sensor histidine kinase/response regulator [Sphingobacteriales bacterium]|nr:hybrid sensor histidine kinase/response regulator [Sphingobacteriales bacterium]
MILIVDDIPENIYSLKKVLQLNNFEVDTALSGEEALKKILKSTYFLIILDVQMPGMDGFEVADAISGSNKTKNIPIIFLSAANTDKRFITKGYASGAVDYITKPVDVDILLLKVKTFYKLYENTVELTQTQASLREEIEFRKLAENKKDEFISMASHELKTPLTSVKGYVHLIKKTVSKYEDTTINGYLTRTGLQLEKLNNLVTDLLDISKIETGKIEFNKHLFDFDKMIDEAIELVQHTQNFKIVKNGLTEINFHGDETRIEQVLINYLTNAIKYSPDSNEVHVNVSLKTENAVYVSVKDFGIGIPTEFQPKIFEKFYRVEASSARFQGLGIGLFICAEIIKRHDGSYGVISEFGKGSEFYFTLPIVN